MKHVAKYNRTKQIQRSHRLTFRLLVLLLLSALLLSACTYDKDVIRDTRYSVVLIGKSADNSFWNALYSGAAASASSQNLNLTITYPENRENYVEQNDLIVQAIEDGANVIVLSAADYEKTVPAVETATTEGIPVIIIDSDVNSEKVLRRIGTDNYKAGIQAGLAVLDSASSDLHVAIISFGNGIANVESRDAGIRCSLNENDRVSEIIPIHFDSRDDVTVEAIADELRKNPRINAVVTTNEHTTLVTSDAVAELGTGNRIWLVGFDSNVKALDYLQTGVVDSLIVQNPYAMGYLGVETAYQWLNGQLNSQQDIETMIFTINRDNIYDTESQKILFPFS